MTRWHPARTRNKNQLFGYVLALPALILVVVLIIVPVVQSVFMSFTDRRLLQRGAPKGVGFSNFSNVLSDSAFLQAAGNTMAWTLANVVMQVCLGTLLAYLLNSKLHARGLLRSFSIIPWVLPSVAAVLMWRSMYDPAIGLFNAVLLKLGMIHQPVIWLGDPQTALPSVLLESIWKGTPFVLIIMLAGMQAIPHSLYEAAAVDGAGSVRTFFSVVLPTVRPTLALATILTAVYSINNFNAVWLMTGGGPLGATEIVFTYGYRKAFVNFDFGQGAAVSVLLFIVLLIFTVIYLFMLDKEVNEA